MDIFPYITTILLRNVQNVFVCCTCINVTCVTSRIFDVIPDVKIFFVLKMVSYNFVTLIVLIKTQNSCNINQSKIPVPARFFANSGNSSSGTSNTGSGASLPTS